MPVTGDFAGAPTNVQRGDTGTTIVSAPPLYLPVFSVGPKRAKRVLAAEKVIESLVVPPYPESSNSGASGVLTMVPVASMEKGDNAKSFIAYKTPSGISQVIVVFLVEHRAFWGVGQSCKWSSTNAV